MSRSFTARGGLAAAVVGLGVLLTPAPLLAQQPDWPLPIHDDMINWFVLFDQLEVTSLSDETPVTWDFQGWVGGDYNRLWMKSEGEVPTRGGGGDFEVQALYSRLIAPFWDFQAGVRYDQQLGRGGLSRAHLVVGLEGLAPYWFEVEPAVFISQDGDVSARLTASYDMLLTQRLILQPEIEMNLAAQTVEEWGVGSGLTDLSAELRLRYEFRREFAPYVGASWFERFGETADLARSTGDRVVELTVLAGFRIWF